MLKDRQKAPAETFIECNILKVAQNHSSHDALLGHVISSRWDRNSSWAPAIPPPGPVRQPDRAFFKYFTYADSVARIERTETSACITIRTKSNNMQTETRTCSQEIRHP